MTRFIISAVIYAAVAVGVGLLLAEDGFAWGVTIGLFAAAMAGEGARSWIKRSRAKDRQSSGI